MVPLNHKKLLERDLKISSPATDCSLLCELLVDEQSSILLFLFVKFGLPNIHSILEPLAILYLRQENILTGVGPLTAS
jgi:hypothetical protein